MSLYMKHCPATFDTLIGDFDWIRRQLDKPDGNHVLLFNGPTGSGKTTLANVCANYLKADPDLDIKKIDVGSDGGIDMIRQLIDDVRYAALSQVKVYILDEFHRISTSGAEASLDLFENVPETVYFFLCTNEPQKLKKTLRDRALNIQLEPHSVKRLCKILTHVATQENFQITEDLKGEIAEASHGSARVAINILERIMVSEEREYMHIMETMGAGDDTPEVIDIAKELLKPKPDKAFLGQALQACKDQDTEKSRRAILGYLSAVMQNNPKGLILDRMQPLLADTYTTNHAGLVYAVMSAAYIL